MDKSLKRLIYFLCGLGALIMVLLFIYLFGNGCITNNSGEQIEHDTATTSKQIETRIESLPEFEIIHVVQQHGCFLLIHTSYDSLPEGEEVRCSITGKMGRYEPNMTDSTSHKRFAAKELNPKIYQVWAIFRMDTIPYFQNGNSLRGYGCD